MLLNNCYEKFVVIVGVKNDEANLNGTTPVDDTSLVQTECRLTSKDYSEPNVASFTEAILEETERERRLGEDVSSESNTSMPNKSLDSNALCKFNGYSNLEISVFFALALFTSVLFHLDMSEFIYKVILR